MKILLLCLRVPWPLTDGGNLAMMSMAEMLQQEGHEVTLFALNTKKHFVEIDKIPEKSFSGIRLISVSIDTGINIREALRNFFRPEESFNVIRFYHDHAADQLKKLLEKESFDIVQFESLFTTPYLPLVRSCSTARTILRAHNVEHVIWERLSQEQTNPFRKAYLKFLARRMKLYESKVSKQVEGILPISPLDEAYFAKHAEGISVHTVPMGIQLSSYPLQSNASLSLFHLGAMDWLPNQEGVKWFLDQCWPLVHDKHPRLPLHLAGRGFPQELMQRSIPMVTFSGTVENAQEFMRDKQIMIVPLRSGSGMRIKILQGLALGKTIIATRIGAEGIDVTDGENILLADTPGAFLEKISICLDDEVRCQKIGASGRKLIEEKYSSETLGRKVTAFYQSLLN